LDDHGCRTIYPWVKTRLISISDLILCFFREKQPFISQASVYLMVIGALIASGDDLTFNWFGYTFLTINNLATAALGVVIKQKLINKVIKNYLNSIESTEIFVKDFNQYGLLFYNSLVVLGPTILLLLFTEDLNKVKDFLFKKEFIISK
jgi:hypothetical protein